MCRVASTQEAARWLEVPGRVLRVALRPQGGRAACARRGRTTQQGCSRADARCGSTTSRRTQFVVCRRPRRPARDAVCCTRLAQGGTGGNGGPILPPPPSIMGCGDSWTKAGAGGCTWGAGGSGTGRCRHRRLHSSAGHRRRVSWTPAACGARAGVMGRGRGGVAGGMGRGRWSPRRSGCPVPPLPTSSSGPRQPERRSRGPAATSPAGKRRRAGTAESPGRSSGSAGGIHRCAVTVAHASGDRRGPRRLRARRRPACRPSGCVVVKQRPSGGRPWPGAAPAATTRSSRWGQHPPRSAGAAQGPRRRAAAAPPRETPRGAAPPHGMWRTSSLRFSRPLPPSPVHLDRGRGARRLAQPGTARPVTQTSAASQHTERISPGERSSRRPRRERSQWP